MKILLSIAILFSASVSAAKLDKEFRRHMRMRACRAVKLTKEQKVSFNQKFLAMRASKVNIMAEMEQAGDDFKAALLTDTTIMGDLTDPIKKIANTKKKLMKVKLTHLSDIVLNVFTLKQKKKGMKCLKRMMKKMRRKARRTYRRTMKPRPKR